MKKSIICLFFIFSTLTMHAQERNISHGISLGYHIQQIQNDFGFGLNLSSPSFFHQRMAVRLRGNMMFLQHPKGFETTWTPYANASLGLVGFSGMVGESIRLYGEGGAIAIFPSPEFSTVSSVFGGYGLFGFEFFMNPGANYFIEIGGVGAGANADKLPLAPIYSNGMSIAAGFRMQF